MGLFKILKSVIGLGSSGSRSTSGTAEPGRENVDVTVEHEPEPDTTSEDAVKGTGEETTTEAASSPATEPAGESDGATEPEAEADESDSEVEPEDEETTEPEVEAEIDDTETATTESDTEDTDEPDAEAEGSDDAEPEVEVENADASTDTIKGIGPSYAETLSAAGIETVGDLAAADATDIAGETDLSEKRVGRWVARARGEDE
ncbi:Helix-hairpin-helix domain-containing protein [Halorientalis persicus]|uniref:Helix-hairpin-helix domain-containing protein n=1 Tax=Halorientalis persicus TaxID=1367881 RepID=A0A1H8ENW7_9EURY|nr:helix-hairpin-helix domain-containing protein [Halorientalis persicus]SEN21142.1 Helix-hairpin-helix domain-containing protein [Halorientalis persicus]